MRRYETVLILRPSLNEKQIDSIVDLCSGLIGDANGKIIELDRWGMRKLAYAIKKEIQGFYILIDYATLPEVVFEMERRFRIDDAVLRYMSIKTAEEISEDEIATATENASNRKIAAAEESSEEDEEDDGPLSHDATTDEDDAEENEDTEE